MEPAIANWNAPPWAASEFVDHGSVEHRACVGEVIPGAEEDKLTVEVIQRDELDVTVHPIAITRTMAHVSVAGVWLEAEQARELAKLLMAAAGSRRSSAAMTRTTPCIER